MSEIRIHRATNLVRQPSRWGAEPLRVVGPDTRGSKATLKSTLSSNLSVYPTSFSSTTGDGLNILSKACAAIGAPRFHVSKDPTETRSDRDDHSPSRRTHLPPSSERILETQFGRGAPVGPFRDPSPTTRQNIEAREMTYVATDKRDVGCEFATRMYTKLSSFYQSPLNNQTSHLIHIYNK